MIYKVYRLILFFLLIWLPAISFGSNINYNKMNHPNKLAVKQEAIFYGAALKWLKKNQGQFRSDWNYPGPILLTDGSKNCKLSSAFKKINLKKTSELPSHWKDIGAKAFCAAIYLDINGYSKAAITVFTVGIKHGKSSILNKTQMTSAISSDMLKTSVLKMWYPNGIKPKKLPLAFNGLDYNNTTKWSFYVSSNKSLRSTNTNSETISNKKASNLILPLSNTGYSIPSGLKRRLNKLF